MLTRMLRGCFVLLILSVLVSAAHANLIVNGGFENPVLPSGGVMYCVGGQNIGGWDVVGAGVALVQTNYGEPGNGITAFTSQEGFNSLDLTGAGNEGLTSGVQETIATTVGQAYSLSFYVGRADGNQFYATPATVDLSIDGGPRVGYTNTAVTPGTNNWRQFTTSFTATVATTTLTFYNGTPSPTAEAGLDDVVLIPSVTAVPEPASALLFLGGAGAGVLALLLRGKRRR